VDERSMVTEAGQTDVETGPDCVPRNAPAGGAR
jgi:hypothetical protein